MRYYEIRNTKTQERHETVAKNYMTACRERGWRPQDCRCVWKADADAANDKGEY